MTVQLAFIGIFIATYFFLFKSQILINLYGQKLAAITISDLKYNVRGMEPEVSLKRRQLENMAKMAPVLTLLPWAANWGFESAQNASTVIQIVGMSISFLSLAVMLILTIDAAINHRMLVDRKKVYTETDAMIDEAEEMEMEAERNRFYVDVKKIYTYDEISEIKELYNARYHSFEFSVDENVPEEKWPAIARKILIQDFGVDPESEFIFRKGQVNLDGDPNQSVDDNKKFGISDEHPVYGQIDMRPAVVMESEWYQSTCGSVTFIPNNERFSIVYNSPFESITFDALACAKKLEHLLNEGTNNHAEICTLIDEQLGVSLEVVPNGLKRYQPELFRFYTAAE